MGFFAARRSGAGEDPRARSTPRTAATVQVPVQFEAVAEALAADAEAQTACAVIGHELARDGIDLGTALDGLRSTYQSVVGTDPAYLSVEALSLAWSEETLAYLHQLSCEDPLTGLASHAHLRARLSEVYRAAGLDGAPPTTSHVLVVVELPGLARASDPFSRALWLVQASEEVRTVFSGGDPICTVGGTRLVVLTSRDPGLGRRLASVRERVSGGATPVTTRVWSERLPASIEGATALLDELSRR